MKKTSVPMWWKLSRCVPFFFIVEARGVPVNLAEVVVEVVFEVEVVLEVEFLVVVEVVDLVVVLDVDVCLIIGPLEL
jgi:hypothetical protein